MNRFIASFCMILLWDIAFAATYTVMPSGGDYATPGACANDVSGGEICEVYNGSYPGWSQTGSGDEDNRIIIRAAGGQVAVNITSSVTSDSGADWYRVEGLNFTNGASFVAGDKYPPKHIPEWIPSNGVQLVNNHFDGTGITIIIAGDDTLVSGNTVINADDDFIEIFGKRFAVVNNTTDGTGMVEREGRHMDGFQSWCSKKIPYPAQYGVIEGNRWVNVTGGDVHFLLINATTGCDVAPSNLIIRRNVVGNIGSSFIVIDKNAQAEGGRDIAVYNNTAYKINNGSSPDWKDYAVSFSGITDGTCLGGNNLFSDAMHHTNTQGYLPTGTATKIHFNSLYFDPDYTVDFDPPASTEPGAVKNQDPLLSNPDRLDFTLASESSPAHDAGGHITTVAGDDIGSGEALVVEHAFAFQPGWGGCDADWIAVGATVETADIVQISRIDYETNTLYLRHSITWAGGEYIWLYRGADGSVVLDGAAPDIGAVEYTGVDTTAPMLLQVRIEANGDDWTFSYSEDVSAADTADLCDDFSVEMSGAGMVSLSYQSGEGTDTVVCTGDKTVDGGETVTSGIDYTPGTIADEAAIPNALVAISGESVTNGSAQGVDITDPVVVIVAPDDDPHDNGTDETADLSGTASDVIGITQVTWACPECPVTSGSATGTISWHMSDIALSPGTNNLTVTAHDAAANTGSDTMAIIYTPADGGDGGSNGGSGGGSGCFIASSW